MQLRRQLIPFRAWLPLAILALHFLLFTLARSALLISHLDSFKALSFGQICWAFVHGLRFDASMIFLVWGLPLTSLFLPFRFFRSRFWRGWILALAGVSLVFHAFLFLADTVYFSYVNRHIGMELVAVFSDTNLFTAMLREDYSLHLAVFTGGATAFGWLYWRLVFRWLHGHGGTGGGWLKTFLFLVIAVVAVRGGLTNRKSVNIVHAFDGPELTAGYLALNAPFAAYHTMRSSVAVRTNFMPEAEAVSLVQADLGMTADDVLLANYPLYRNGLSNETTPTTSAPLNVVVIMLESWDAWYVDTWRKAKGKSPLGLTPEFDKLAAEGRFYSDFYATGQRSVHGVAAILASMPTLPGMPYIGTGGLEANGLSFVSTLAKCQDYSTFFFRSAGRESYRLNRVAQVGSFDLYKGSEDFLAANPQAETHKFGVWDDLMFHESAQYMATLKQPFFGFLFPSSTHHPFAVPDSKWEKDVSGDREGRYKNSLRYSDSTLGEFFRAMRAQGQFDNTLFVITGDHVSGVRQGDIPMPERFLLPCLLIGPGIEPGVDERTCSQLDISPTIIDLCGWTLPHASLGTSLFAPVSERGAIMATENEVLRKEGDQWLVHNLDRRLTSTNSPGIDQIEKRLLATVQVVHALLRANRVMPQAE